MRPYLVVCYRCFHVYRIQNRMGMQVWLFGVMHEGFSGWVFNSICLACAEDRP